MCEKDLPVGEKVVACFRPFLEDLVAPELSSVPDPPPSLAASPTPSAPRTSAAARTTATVCALRSLRTTARRVKRRATTNCFIMPTEQEFQTLLKRVEELEALKENATNGLSNHMEGINTHDKLIQELQHHFKVMADNMTKGLNNLTDYINKKK
jgi:hypothetical protein